MHPEPLFRMPEDQPLEDGVVGARSAPDLLTYVGVFDRRHGILEAQHVPTIGLAPACRRHYRRTGRQRDDGQALEGPGTMPEKFALDSVRRTRVLVEREDDDVAGR